MLRKVLLSLLVLSVAFSFGCGNEDPGETGTIVLNLSMDQGRTILPDIDMEPASYDLSGTGPGGATFSVSTDEETVEIPGLAFGEWTIGVNAKNAEGTIIAQGSETATVHTGETTVVDIVVTPIEGIGTLNLTLLWNAGDTENPSIEAQLIPSVGAAIDLDFTITGGDTGTYSSSAIPTGYHTLIIKLMDNGILTMGAVEVVRIVNEETTSGTFEFYEINKPGGTIQVNIIPDMYEPIDVTMTGQRNNLGLGQTMTVTASVPSDTGNVLYVWYINGESKETGDTYEAGADLPIGVYRLDVTAFTTDGTRAGSATHTFYVVERCEELIWTGDYTISDQASMEALAGYTDITGSLTIESSTLTELTGLECLYNIGGSLIVQNNTLLTDLDGLSSLESVGGGLSIFDNASLTNLNGLNGITSFGGNLDVRDNASLMNLDSLSSVTYVGGYLSIQRNIVLTNIDGLSGINSIGGDLWITYNDALANVNGLSALTFVVGGLNILYNASLTNLDGISELTSIGGDLRVGHNNSIINIDGLSGITSVIGKLSIWSNASLTNVIGLSGITSVGSQISISENAAIINLDGLNALTSVGGNLVIGGNNALTNLDSLSGITTVGGAYISIINNNALTNLDGLSGITSVVGNLWIQSNASLTNIDGLSNITSVGSSLSISSNAVLTNIDGLSGITSVGSSLSISSNAVLTNIDGLSGITSVGSDLWISGNGSITNLNGLSSLVSIGRDLKIQNNVSLTILGLTSLTTVSRDFWVTDNTVLPNQLAYDLLGQLIGFTGVVNIYGNLE